MPDAAAAVNTARCSTPGCTVGGTATASTGAGSLRTEAATSGRGASHATSASTSRLLFPFPIDTSDSKFVGPHMWSEQAHRAEVQ